MNTENLTVRRQVDRYEIADLVMGVARKHGCVALLTDDFHLLGEQRLTVNIKAPGGLTVLVDLDGKRQKPNAHVLSWNLHGNLDAKLNPSEFAFGSVNQYHFHKATDVANGTPELLRVLDLRLASAKAGTAYQASTVPEPEPALA